MGKSQNSEWYDGQFRTDKDYAKKFTSSRYFGMWKKIVTKLKKMKGRILELGAGPGQFAAMLEDAGIVDYVGLDFSQVAVEMASKNTKLRIVCKSIEDADLETDKSYETVVMLEVLEHLDDDKAVLKRLRKGAKVVFTVPTFDGTSHVRFFETIADVKKRYGKFFAAFTVEESGTDHFIGTGTIK